VSSGLREGALLKEVFSKGQCVGGLNGWDGMVRRARGKWEGTGVEVVGSLCLRNVAGTPPWLGNKRAVRGTVNPSGVLRFRRGRVFSGDFFAKGLCLELVRGGVFSGEVLFWGLCRVFGDFGVLVRSILPRGGQQNVI